MNDNMEIINNNNKDIDELSNIISNINLEEIDVNNIKKIYNNNLMPIKTSKYMTLYEYTAIIGKRATQIEDNCPILINDYNSDSSVINIAKEEIKKGVIPYIIRRPLPNGTYEDVRISNLIIREEY